MKQLLVDLAAYNGDAHHFHSSRLDNPLDHISFKQLTQPTKKGGPLKEYFRWALQIKILMGASSLSLALPMPKVSWSLVSLPSNCPWRSLFLPSAHLKPIPDTPQKASRVRFNVFVIHACVPLWSFFW